MIVKNVKASEIKSYKKNAKKHPPEQVERIANSIKEFGFRQPLVLDKDNVLIIGHGRLEAAKKLGLEEIPAVYADDLTDEQVKALRLADNKVAESEWDFGLLSDELDGILNFDMSDFGFDDLQEEKPAEVKTVELKPYKKVHYLISLDINDNDKIIDLISEMRNMEGIEVESTLN